MLIIAGVFIVCGLTMLVLSGFISKEHSKAIDEYNRNNWTTVENVSGGRSIYGMADGVSFKYLDKDNFFEGITVDGVPIGGMSYGEARETVKGIIEDRLNAISMTVSVGNASLALSAQDFNITVNAEEVLEEAFQLGRENINDYYANYKKQMEMKENSEKGEPVNFQLEYVCDRDAIMARVDSIARFVNNEPVEPYITIAQRMQPDPTGKAVMDTIYSDTGAAIAFVYFHPGSNGYTLNEEAMLESIVSAFDAGDYSCSITAELENTAPKKTVEEVQASFQRITTYTSEFNADKRNRSRNIQKAAGILNGCEIKAGEEISFNEYIGPRTEADGWLRAPGIVGGKEYEDSPGGGICQVSGTLYNALLQCGPDKIKITQRRHHSWPSEYVPYGLDATVDTNGPDLRWRNISDSPIYIFAYADLSKGKMYIYVYAEPESDGSYYETWAETVETIEPEEPVIKEDSQLPAGTRKTTITARKGYVAKAYLKHFDKDGNLIETIYLYTDRYSPVRGEITVGTGDPSVVH